MIGYYIHHVGLGHLHRALAVVRHLPGPVTALSSLPADARWPGPWETLPRDDAGGPPKQPTAGGFLHWAPLHDAGLRERMAVIADFVATHRPAVMVVDLSAEVVMLTRLMGIPVVAVSLPGVRDDPAHRHGYELADAIVAPWPARFRDVGPSLKPFSAKVHYVGAISRYEALAGSPSAVGSPSADVLRVLALSGLGAAESGGAEPVAPGSLPGWEWHALGAGNWNPDPWNDIRAADVVVTHAGLGALADVAIAGRPAVIIPQARPHQEQVTTASALARSGLAVVADAEPTSPAQWLDLLGEARRMGGSRWPEWADGYGGERMAEVIVSVAEASSRTLRPRVA